MFSLIFQYHSSIIKVQLWNPQFAAVHKNLLKSVNHRIQVLNKSPDSINWKQNIIYTNKSYVLW